MEERLQKLLSAAGVCSRRTAETYLIAGRVTVNGQTAHLGQRADPDRDEILVDGRPLAPRAEAVYILLNKPRGYVSTLSDERGRRTVAELVGHADTGFLERVVEFSLGTRHRQHCGGLIAFGPAAADLHLEDLLIQGSSLPLSVPLSEFHNWQDPPQAHPSPPCFRSPWPAAGRG